jgi:hypothetical protein
MALNTLQNTINFIQPFCRYMGANIGVSNEPMISIGNIVRNIILAAPFTWSFNRNTYNFETIPGQTDYSALNNFNVLLAISSVEIASVQDSSNNTWQITDIINEGAVIGGFNATTIQGRPSGLCVYQNFLSNNGANPPYALLRVSPTPDAAYLITMSYQTESPQFVNVTDSWAPIPNSFSDVYNNLCLGYYMESCQDPRGQQFIARGAARLLSRSTGLKEMDKIIFAKTYMNLDMSQEKIRSQQGVQAEGQA